MNNLAHTGTVHVDAPPRRAFQLFTAPGEKLWIEEWDPDVLSGGDGRSKNAVWLTGHGGEQTIWLVVDYDPEALHARYARVTPGSRAGTVEVFAHEDGQGGTDVKVSYVLTALNDEGNKALAEFGDGNFAQMMAHWENVIRSSKIDFQASLFD